MKINWIKCIIAFFASALLGLLCFEIATELDSRNWIALVISTLSIFSGLCAALAIESDKVLTNLKVSAWLFTVVLIVTNIVFCLFYYNIIAYIVIVGLLMLANVGISYALANRK